MTLRRRKRTIHLLMILGVDVKKIKELEGINGPVLTINERNAQIDNKLSHLYGMQMLQLRMNGVTEEQLKQLNIDYHLSEHSRVLCSVGLGYEEPLDDDVAMEDEMARPRVRRQAIGATGRARQQPHQHNSLRDAQQEWRMARCEASVFPRDGRHGASLPRCYSRHAASLFHANATRVSNGQKWIFYFN
ncbi:hypothetical protein HAX54_047285 [Datura stramonium]|uniref:Uncharacterized protein n=1 Tax=Datura stramonium TaxID=4076 RepID=A0ABS8STP1_DATST|nr:hypothetical protein [Datura stramonium]